MFSKMLIFTFCVIVAFTLLFASIPGDFFVASYESSVGADKEIAEAFTLANITCYDLMGQDNMTYDYTSLVDHPSAPEFSLNMAEQYLEVWWGAEGLIDKTLEFRHTEKGFLGLWYHHTTKIYDKNHEAVSFTFGTPPVTYHDRIVEGVSNYYGTFNLLTDSWDDDANASIFYAECDHLSISSLIGFNQSAYADIAEAYNAGELSYKLSYEVNWNATSVSALNVLGLLLSFQTPSLGIPDATMNGILGTLTASIFWVMVAIMIIKLVQSIVPFISGLRD